ncbi:type I restriction enzyme HsdR N-terminal domain-containing protein [Leptolyngbya sp. FACHB-541]|uniref:type I restriction enzyme HsdR N-terminal domain-containing protein n=1 Tax=Leptolyngbya sp. FACHB-541 TaxID=2692810 RepID=UPI0016828419|nr:type I restriction enzyme HsdR N-terminal domain-containing protein [Leptolyngbya sp. FACHB-541]MBD1995533.1 type I restriction enzyme HsdR N-terminal domain-containing protein [Leptolyngbya sp. FACHB-541]
MKFEDYDFSLLNESDIREEIIAPLLRYLGYRSGTSANIIREQSLRYPRVFLGRKDTKKDPELRGRADYICEVDSSVRWIIEAKPPVDITLNDIEQSYTYANHPGVRAVYFCLINGLQVKIYQTNQGPDALPLLEVNYEKLDENFSRIQNVIGPDAIRRDHPRIEPDIGEPIGKGLRSIVRVTSGSVVFTSSNVSLPILEELTLTISGGSVERNENQHLIAYLQSQMPFRSMNELNTKLGLDRFELVSTEMNLSSNSLKPTLFTEVTNTVLPAGDTVFDPYNWKPLRLLRNISYRTETQAEGILTERRFHGAFRLKYQLLDFNQTIDAQGKFELHLA